MTTDIRPTLRQRLKAIDAELADLDKRRDRLVGLKDAVTATIEQENVLAANGSAHQEELALHPTGRGALSDHVLYALRNGPLSLDDLKGRSRDWFPTGYEKSIGRALNFVLVGLQKGGHVERLQNGAWKRPTAGSPK